MNNPSTNVGDLPPQQQAIRAKCFHPNGTFVEFKKEEVEQSIGHRFEDQVRKYTDRLAIKTGSEQLTYDELNRSANRVAHAILAYRRERQEPVALVLEHGLPEIVGTLACLKAGKIYLQIDRSLPGDRIAFMLEDSGAGLILTNVGTFPLAENLACNRYHFLNIDALDPTISDENPHLPISPDAAAHIIYTSGSTGPAKGKQQKPQS